MLNSNNLCVAILATILQLACHGDTLNDGSVATGIGGSVVVRCSGGFVPSGELSVHWLGPRSLLISINGDILYSGHGNKYRINKVHEGNYELVVNDVSESDVGEYECKFVNKQGVTVHSKRVRLNINAPPKIVTPEIQEMKVSEGRSLTLFCNYSGYPKPTVTWKFRAENNQLSRIISTDQSQISLYNVTLKDAGQYECHADNGERPPAFISYTISVTSGPRLHTPYSRIYQKIGHLLHIQCIVTWKPSGRYFWEFQDLKIVTDDSMGATGNDGNNNNDNKNVSITSGKYVLSSKIPSSSPPSSSSTSSSSSQLQSTAKYVTSSYNIDEHTTMLGLFIEHLALSDAGFYRCKFQNEYGQSQGAIEVVALTEIAEANNNSSSSNNNNNSSSGSHHPNHKHVIREVNAMLNEDVVLKCHVRGNNVSAIWWRKSNDGKLATIPLSPLTPSKPSSSKPSSPSSKPSSPSQPSSSSKPLSSSLSSSSSSSLSRPPPSSSSSSPSASAQHAKYELLNGRHLLIHRVSYGDRGYYSCVSSDKYDTTGDNKDTDDKKNDTSDVFDYEDGDTEEKFTWYLSILEQSPATSCQESAGEVKVSTMLALLGAVVAILLLTFAFVMLVVVSRHKRQLDLSRDSVKESICSMKKYEDV